MHPFFGRRTLPVLLAAATLVALAASASTAQADPWGRRGERRGNRCGVRARGCGCEHDVGYRGAERACYESRSVRRFYQRGQSWTLLRRHLHRLRIEPTHIHPRNYWLRRWPCDIGRGWRSSVCIGHDHPTLECDIVTAALAGAEGGVGVEDRVDAQPVEFLPAERLARGMERFFRAAYDEAAEDFEVVAAADATDARPRYGLFLCDVMRKDTDGAAGQLRRLVDLGALRASDRLEIEGSFGDAKAFGRVLQGLEAYTRYQFQDTEAQVVTAWAFLATGDVAKARTHLKAAKRFAPRDRVANELLAQLNGTATAEPTQEPATAPAENEETHEATGSEPGRPALPDRAPPDNLARHAG